MIKRKNKALSRLFVIMLGTVSVMTVPLSAEVAASENVSVVAEYEVQKSSASVIGDLNGDGDITLEDDNIFKDYFAGKVVTNLNLCNADIDGDKNVTRKDAMILARFLADWPGYTLEGEEDSEKLPWEVPGAKQPIDYTYAEFENLTASQQMAFQSSFGSYEVFDAWLQKALSGDTDEETLPWEVQGAKQPIEYTYADFEALTPGQQMAFQNSFGSYEAFEAWLQKALSGNVGDTEEETLPWEVPGAKQPIDYTYEEFETLTPAQQMAFQNAIDFDAWLDRVQMGGSSDETMPWDKPGATRPEDYSYEDFEDLTPAQQMAFQNAIDFDAWLDRVQMGGSSDETMPWDKPGATRPEDYTYADFECLTPAQQMAFQNAIDFDAWLEKNEP